MTREEIIHLADLARIELTEAEVERFTVELSAILSYVGKVQALVAEVEGGVVVSPQVGARHNVFRDDLVTNEPGSYTADLLAEMPKTDGSYLVVKKILQAE